MPSTLHFGIIALTMVLSVVIGFVWYGPLFGKPWMKLSGLAMPETKPSFGMMIKPLALSLVGSFMMSYVLSCSIAFHDAYYNVSGYVPGLSIAFLMWLGFIVPVYLSFSGWEGKPWKLFWIHAGYWFVFIMITATLTIAFV